MAGAAPEPSLLRFALRALGYRNYRLFFAGQIVSLVGTWLTQVATGWLVYRVTESTEMLGVVTFAGQIPAFLLAPLAGVLVDRWPLRRVLVITQVLSMLQSFGLAWVAFRGGRSIATILALYVLQGLINAFDLPARQAFVIEMVERREDLPSAIALNSSMVNLARLVGPPLAGVLIYATSEAVCFTIDGFSYAGVIVALLAMRVAPRPERGARGHLLREMSEGFRYAWGFTPIRAILMLLAVVSLVGAPYSVLMPVFARDVFHGDARTLGLLTGASGVGALIGGAYLASRRSVLGLGRLIPLGSAAFGLGLIGFSYARGLPAALPLLLLTGMSMMVEMAASNTVLQTLVEDDKRGRVMSFFAMAFMGMMPIGSLLAGALAAPQRLGAPATVAVGGVGCLMGAALFARALPELRARARPVYVGRGILPAAAAGAEVAAELGTAAER